MLRILFLISIAGYGQSVVVVEAEAFVRQEQNGVRKWERKEGLGASGGAYLQALPDTRRTHDD